MPFMTVNPYKFCLYGVPSPHQTAIFSDVSKHMNLGIYNIDTNGTTTQNQNLIPSKISLYCFLCFLHLGLILTLITPTHFASAGNTNLSLAYASAKFPIPSTKMKDLKLESI